MSEKHSKASKARMLAIPIAKRTKMMSELAHKRWEKWKIARKAL